MAEKSNIQWTDATWNIARGCTKISEGCKFCYMMRDGSRYGYDGTKVKRTKNVFNLPLRIQEPSRIFTSSLTDFFHEDIDSFREEAWDIIRRCPQHTFQILTKRTQRIAANLPPDWGKGYDNVWLGFSAENQDRYNERYLQTYYLPAKVKFVSIEPLLAPIRLDGDMEWDRWNVNVDWVIIGGESGFGRVAEDKNVKWQYRKCEIDWIRSIVRECRHANVPVFVKQMGTHLAKELKMSDSHGGNIFEFPKYLRVRQFPNIEPEKRI